MALHLLDQRLPEIAIADGLLLRVLPPVLTPALVPLVAEAVDDVCAVAVERDVPVALHCAQPFDGPAQLHALVGRGRLPAGEVSFERPVDDDGGPAAGSRIAGAGTVAVDRDDIELCQPCHGRRPSMREGTSRTARRFGGTAKGTSVRRPSRDSGRRTRSGSACSAAAAPAGAGVAWSRDSRRRS